MLQDVTNSPRQERVSSFGNGIAQKRLAAGSRRAVNSGAKVSFNLKGDENASGRINVQRSSSSTVPSAKLKKPAFSRKNSQPRFHTLPKYWFDDPPQHWFREWKKKKSPKQEQGKMQLEPIVAKEFPLKSKLQESASETADANTQVSAEATPTLRASKQKPIRSSNVPSKMSTIAKMLQRKFAVHVHSSRTLIEKAASHAQSFSLSTQENRSVTILKWAFLFVLIYVSIFDPTIVLRAASSAQTSANDAREWFRAPPKAEPPKHFHDVFVMREPKLIVTTPVSGDTFWTSDSIIVRMLVRNVYPRAEATHKTPRVCMRVVASVKTTFTIFSGCYFAMEDGGDSGEDEISVRLPPRVLSPGTYVIYASLVSEVTKLSKAESRSFLVELPPDSALAPPPA